MRNTNDYRKKIAILWAKLRLPSVVYPFIFTTSTWGEWWFALSRLLRVRGPNLEAKHHYEVEFARTTHHKFGISFGSGRMALYAILKSLGLSDGDEVILAAYTCSVVPRAIINAGLKPVYIDISQEDFNLDATQIETAITARTRVVYVQNTFGVPADYQTILAIAEKHSLALIEDNAHGPIGDAAFHQKARSENQRVKRLSFYSTDRSKYINTMLGGIAVTNDQQLAEALQNIQTSACGFPKAAETLLILNFVFEFLLTRPAIYWLGDFLMTLTTGLGLRFSFANQLKPSQDPSAPYPCQISTFSAELGLMQLSQIKKNDAHRRSILGLLYSLLGFEPPAQPPAMLRLPLLVTDQRQAANILRPYFESSIWFDSPFLGHEGDFRELEYSTGSCPVAEYVSRSMVNLPIHPAMTRRRLGSSLEKLKGLLITSHSKVRD